MSNKNKAANKTASYRKLHFSTSPPVATNKRRTRNTKDRYTEERERRNVILRGLNKEHPIKGYDSIYDVSPVEFYSLVNS